MGSGFVVIIVALASRQESLGVKALGEWQESFTDVVVVELSSKFTEIVDHLEGVECDHKESGVRDKEPRQELWVPGFLLKIPHQTSESKDSPNIDSIVIC